MSEVALIREIERLKRRAADLERIEPRPIACRVYNDAAFTHNSTGNYLAITFNTERWDTSGMHEGVTNPSRITFTLGGWYLVGGCIYFLANATGQRQITIRLGGANHIALANSPSNSATYATHLAVATLYYFAATNYVELCAYQNSGGNLDIGATANYSPEFWAIRMA